MILIFFKFFFVTEEFEVKTVNFVFAGCGPLSGWSTLVGLEFTSSYSAAFAVGWDWIVVQRTDI